MKSKSESPIYSQIALDVAVRIARGDLKENARISGRSLMASEYNVSPETIRRSFQLLADAEIIKVLPGSGSVVLSREKAILYIGKLDISKDFRSLKHELKKLLNERDQTNKKIIGIIDDIIDVSERLRNTNPLYTLEFEIPETSSLVGVSITESNFWQNTGGTIVAIKRADKMILSPGPYAIFMAGDIVVVTGDIGVKEKIESFINR